MTPTQFESAQEFLARVVPWDGTSFVSIHHTFPVPDREKPGWSGTSNRDLSGAMRTLKFITGRPNTRDIYVCMASLRGATEKTKGKARWFASNKHADNAVALKSLFVDVDVKAGAYATTEDGVRALIAFCRAIDMPAPTGLVESGSGGFHAYWVLSRALSVAEWQPLAFALAEATKQHGLICDTQCTVDCVRVLRIPGTGNYKHTPERPVVMRAFRPDDYSVERVTRALAPFIGRSVASSTAVLPMGALLPPRPAPADRALLDELAAGVEITTAPPALLADLAAACPFVAGAITTGGDTFRNPLWNMTTLLATFCVEGEQAAHQMACRHPEYTAESTSELYARKERERAVQNLGWPQCRAISACGAVECAACQNFANGRSPLNFARPAPVTQPVIPAAIGGVASTTSPIPLPDGYTQDASGMVFLQTLDDQGSTKLVPVFPRTIREPWVQKDPWVLHWLTEDPATGGDQRVQLKFASMATKDAMAKELFNQGLPVSDRTFRNFKDFIMSWMEKLAQQRSVVDSRPFGWIRVDGEDRFVFGNRIWGKGPDIPAGAVDPVLARSYLPTGTAAPWMDAAKMTTDQKRPELDAILASSFAAPLVKFTGQHGLLMSVYSSESGIGKSTTLKIAQAVWGNPHSAVQSLTDTFNSVVGKIGTLRHLPCYWDELKTEDDTKRFTALAFQLTQGKEKSRMASDASQREPGTWQTMLVSASNDSIIDYITRQTRSTTAGAYRVFEFAVTPRVNGTIGIGTAARMVDRLEAEFGMIGLEYAKWLGANAEQVDADVSSRLQAVEKKVAARSDERFWTATIAVLLQGATYANALGFTAIDVTALETHLLRVLADMRSEIDTSAVDMNSNLVLEDLIGQYLAELGARRTLQTNRMPGGPGGSGSSGVTCISDTTRIDAVLAQIAVDDKRIRLARSQFNDWLRRNDYSTKIIQKRLSDLGARETRSILGAGTSVATPTQVWCIDIDMTKLGPIT